MTGVLPAGSDIDDREGAGCSCRIGARRDEATRPQRRRERVETPPQRRNWFFFEVIKRWFRLRRHLMPLAGQGRQGPGFFDRTAFIRGDCGLYSGSKIHTAHGWKNMNRRPDPEVPAMAPLFSSPLRCFTRLSL